MRDFQTLWPWHDSKYFQRFFSPFLQPPSTIQENVTASPNGRVQDVDLPNRIANWSQCDKRAEICVPTLQLYFRNFLWTKKKMSFFLSFLFWCDTQKSFLYIKRNRKNSGVIINHSLLISVLKGISRRVLILFYSPGTHCLKILKMFNLENWRQKKFLLVNSWKRKWEGIISKAEKSFSYLFFKLFFSWGKYTLKHSQCLKVSFNMNFTFWVDQSSLKC